MKKNLAMKLYGASRRAYLNGHRRRAQFFSGLNRVICSCQIPPSANLDKSVYLLHSGLGVVIHEQAVIGAGTIICQNVTIAGGRGGGRPGGGATIGENCLLGAGAVTIGPITIGDGSKIGANAVVLEDVPANSTAVGLPARLVH